MKKFAASECRLEADRLSLWKVHRGIRHHLIAGLIYRSTGKDPKSDGYSFAEVPDWQLRQWAEVVNRLASGIEARSDETLQAAQPERREPVPSGDAQTTKPTPTKGR